MSPTGAVVAALSGLLVATSPAWTPFLAVDFWLLRGLDCVAMAALLAAGERTRHPLVATPAFLLLAVALVFYSLIPAMFIPQVSGAPLPIGPGLDPLAPRHAAINAAGNAGGYLRYIPGSAGEQLVLAFVGAGAALLALLPLHLIKRKPGSGPAVPAGIALGMVLIFGIAYQAGKRLPVGAEGLADLCAPLVLLGMAALVVGRARLRMVVVGCVVGSALLMPFMLKAAVLFGVSVLLWYCVQMRGRARLGIVAALALVVMLGLLAAGINRGLLKHNSLPQTLYTKLVERQSETIYCLNFVLRQPDDGRSPFYALEALVPRLLWPAKPSLSSGGDFAVKYCGVIQASGPSQHSGSVTLVGEPLARAGGGGLMVAGLLLAAIMLASTLACLRGGRVGAAALALTPTLIDFDQLFAMYLASSVRAALIMAAALAVLEARRFGRPPC